MRARPFWPLVRPFRPLVATLALGVALAGCGKTLPGEGQGEANPTAIAPVNPQGAGGLATKNTTRLGGADAVVDAAAVALAVNPGLTAASRPQAVVLVDEREWPTALAAAALAGAPLGAPLLYSDGGSLPAVSAQALETMRPRGAVGLGGAQVIAVGASAASAVPAGYRVRTLTGSGSYALAAQVAKLVASIRSETPRQVVVAAADGPPGQAMPAAGLAAQSAAPLLLVGAAGVPAATSGQLKRWHKPSIYVVGSSASVSSATLGQLGRYGRVKRIESPVGQINPADPVGNSIAVALYSEGGFGWAVDGPGHGLVFANVSRPLDAPAAAPLSASGEYGPLLLLEVSTAVPAVLGEYLTDIRPGYSEAPAYRPVHGAYNHGWLIGDESAISARTQAELDGMLEIAPSNSSSTATNSSASTTTASATATASATSTATETTTAETTAAATHTVTTPATSLPLPKK